VAWAVAGVIILGAAWLASIVRETKKRRQNLDIRLQELQTTLRSEQQAAADLEGALSELNTTIDRAQRELQGLRLGLGDVTPVSQENAGQATGETALAGETGVTIAPPQALLGINRTMHRWVETYWQAASSITVPLSAVNLPIKTFGYSSFQVGSSFIKAMDAMRFAAYETTLAGVAISATQAYEKLFNEIGGASARAYEILNANSPTTALLPQLSIFQSPGLNFVASEVAVDNMLIWYRGAAASNVGPPSSAGAEERIGPRTHGHAGQGETRVWTEKSALRVFLAASRRRRRMEKLSAAA
jgi:hypothetical protein